MADTVREIERKYAATDRTRLPDLTAVHGVAAVVEKEPEILDATYYDTVALRLTAHGITLRRRTGGHDPGWHLKLPAGPHARDEIQAPPAVELPGDLAGLVRSRVRGAALVPVMRLRTRRVRRQLVGADGAVLAEIAVDAVRAERPGGAGGAVTWAEIEAEVTAGGGPGLLDALDACLVAGGIRRSDAPSKLARALAATAPVARRVERPPERKRSTATAGDVVLTYAREQARVIVALDPAVRRELPDAVHRMRVATRRLRSTLRSCRAVLDRTVTDPVAVELKWLAGELGADRDREVLAARIQDGLAAPPVPPCAEPARARVRAWSRARRSGSRRQVAVALDGRRYLALLDTLDGLLADPPLCKAAGRAPCKVLTKAVRKDFARLARRMADVPAAPAGPQRDLALHEARKAAKRARYAAEAARPALGGRAERFARRIADLQQLLGDHHDSVVAREALRELAGAAQEAGESGFAFGVLHGREEAVAADRERELPGRWAKAARSARRLGLTG
ncbi:CYTH and CHAD domain-containing protein [Streptomyces pinistramenti]|uniref:CYTH and CHAD domain-containing protein n=1 Tax=Streptomyces pinistramenti TaxID=2884812 RepID=UPI001D064833|nr:CYTH and CHAD domain-containing protein [Streptomyces pinistramenti]MCB5906737.1 CYTH and CHAD domain-containing protein [Streptomyces pinistramenti]